MPGVLNVQLPVQPGPSVASGSGGAGRIGNPSGAAVCTHEVGWAPPDTPGTPKTALWALLPSG